MQILAFDTTTRLLSACVWRDGDVAAERSLEMERGHAEALVPILNDILREAGMGYDGLDAIGVTTGPGAFTGIRIGLATARGLALATGRPAVGVGTLDALVHTVIGADDAAGADILAALDTKRQDLYVQLFGDGGDPLTDIRICTPPEIGQVLRPGRDTRLVGDAAPLIGDMASTCSLRICSEPLGPSATAIAGLAADRLRQHGAGAIASPEPIYVRPPEATLPAESGSG